MLNPFKEINWNPDVAERRKFGRSLIIGFPCVALLLFFMQHIRHGGWHSQRALSVAGIGISVGLLFLALPQIAKPFYLVWYFVAACIGLVVGNVLLALAFYGLITPFGLARRLFGKRSNFRKPDQQAKTYWHDAEQQVDPKRYYRQF